MRKWATEILALSLAAAACTGSPKPQAAPCAPASGSGSADKSSVPFSGAVRFASLGEANLAAVADISSVPRPDDVAASDDDITDVWVDPTALHPQLCIDYRSGIHVAYRRAPRTMLDPANAHAQFLSAADRSANVDDAVIVVGVPGLLVPDGSSSNGELAAPGDLQFVAGSLVVDVVGHVGSDELQRVGGSILVGANGQATPSGDGITEPMSLQGVPFPVCRPVSIEGTFGNGNDTAWTFAKERGPGAGCQGAPGLQFVGVGTADRVDAMWQGSSPIMGLDRRWAPYAAPDIDGDGIDEIALATGYGPGWTIQLWLFGIGDGGVVPVTWAAGGTVSEWNTELGQGRSENGARLISGLYCGKIPSAPGQGAGLVEWQSSSDLPTRVYATLWTPLNGELGASYSTTYNVRGPAEYPPTGERSICGSPSHQPPEA
jgi:hypothetical protein